MASLTLSCGMHCGRRCRTLGLTSIAPLWQRAQPRLLRDMIDGGLEAILVKVAAMGVCPRRVDVLHASSATVQLLSRGGDRYCRPNVSACRQAHSYDGASVESAGASAVPCAAWHCVSLESDTPSHRVMLTERPVWSQCVRRRRRV